MLIYGVVTCYVLHQMFLLSCVRLQFLKHHEIQQRLLSTFFIRGLMTTLVPLWPVVGGLYLIFYFFYKVKSSLGELPRAFLGMTQFS